MQKYEFTFADDMKENLKNKGYDPRHRNMILVAPKDGLFMFLLNAKKFKYCD